MNGAAWISSTHRPMGFPEFVIVIASIMALNPLAMDMMLPALPNIGSAFHIVLANRPQEILSTFLIGFGVGQFVAEVARGSGRARRLSSDRDQPPDHWLRAGGRRRAGLTLRFRVLV
jgi:hypothetical protein